MTREIETRRRLAISLGERKYISLHPSTVRFLKKAAHKVDRRMGKLEREGALEEMRTLYQTLQRYDRSRWLKVE
ncbi:MULTISPECIES: hypothetical protein [unclassified Meiothermus]|uniref:hypothetical protein n=1 Tax=unclassified Meiothermus TaxID=370471 RepID=UPI000D7C7670|nr:MULTISPECIES: hypothetical protein [unclassified Meiothermus]PZA05824.1 hypothetical protein DNA98_16840 [Meiothermus sp. Pnk-1]RYM27521.1 hypothetical protein EWH23_16510 [Meiothermus sp. PNK-Is4]